MTSARRSLFYDGLWRTQLAMGMGFFSMMVGAFLASFAMPALAAIPVLGLKIIFYAFLSSFWAYAVAPALAWLIARKVALAPWPAAVGCIGTGVMFLVAIRAVSTDDNSPPVWSQVLQAVLWGAGLWLTQRAIRRARPVTPPPAPSS